MAFLRLAASADVVVESFRPGVMDRLGVGWDVLREANPSLVYCAITGYGQDGPLRSRAGHDLNYLARTGRAGAERRRRRAAGAGRGADRRHRRRGADGGLRDPGRAALGQRASSWTSRWPTARCRCWRCRPPGSSRAATCRGAGSSCWAGGCSVTASTSAPTASCRSARWSRSSSPRSAAVSGREDLIAHQFDAPGLGRARRGGGGAVVADARASGRRSTPSTTAAWRPVLELDEVVADEQVRGARDDRRRACWPRRCGCPRRPRTSAAAARPGSASTPPRCWARPATTRPRSPRCASRGRRSDARRRLLHPRSATAAFARRSARPGRGTRAISTRGRRRRS